MLHRVSTRSAADRTWHSSQGITFRSPSQLQAWRVSQGAVLSESSESSGSAYSRASVHTDHPLSVTSDTITLPGQTVSNPSKLGTKRREHLDRASCHGKQRYRPELVDSTTNTSEPPTALSKVQYKSNSQLPPTAPTLELHESNILRGAKTEISNYGSRFRKKAVKCYDDLVLYIDAMSDEILANSSAINGYPRNVRLEIDIRRRNVLQTFYTLLFFIGHRRQFENLAQVSEQDRAKRHYAIRCITLNRKLMILFHQHAALHLNYRQPFQQKIEPHHQRRQLSNGNSRYISFLIEKYLHKSDHSKQNFLSISCYRSSRLNLLYKKLRNLWEERQMLSNSGEITCVSRSKEIELNFSISRTKRRLASVWPMLRLNRPIMTRLWRQSMPTTYASFSTLNSIKRAKHVDDSQIDEAFSNGSDLQSTKWQEYQSQGRLQGRELAVNQTNRTFEMNDSKENKNYPMRSKHSFYDSSSSSSSSSVHSSRSAEISYPTFSKTPVFKTENNRAISNEDCKEYADQEITGYSYGSLQFRIPEAKMQEIMDASPESRLSYWQYTLYQGPAGEKVKVHYCKSKETTERIAKLFLDQEVVGFDIEWKSQAMAEEGIKKNVALIQLACEERIALFHIARYAKDEIEDLVAPTLQKIMESSTITKVGVSIKADCTRLRRFMGIDSRGLFELSHLYKLVKFASGDVKKINKVLVALAQQVEEHLQLPLWKGAVRNSDWSEELDYEQIRCTSPDCPIRLMLILV